MSEEMFDVEKREEFEKHLYDNCKICAEANIDDEEK